MENVKKIVMGGVAALALVTASVMGTMAYLQGTDEVNNTFTVGKVNITLDETHVDDMGNKIDETRVKENSYKLIPGHTYTKDPTVTVTKGSEESYVRAKVTFVKSDKLQAALGDESILSVLKDIDGNWELSSNDPAVETKEGVTSTTFEFRYLTTVTPESNVDTVLPSLFKSVELPGSVTNDELKDLADMNIDVKAEAIQADGFDSADAAWTAFDNQK